MRTAAREIAPQLALRNSSKELCGKIKTKDFGEGRAQCNQALILQKVFLLVTGPDVTMK